MEMEAREEEYRQDREIVPNHDGFLAQILRMQE